MDEHLCKHALTFTLKVWALSASRLSFNLKFKILINCKNDRANSAQ